MSWKPEDGTIRRPDIQGMFHDVRVQIDARDRERERERTRVRPLLKRCEAMLAEVERQSRNESQARLGCPSCDAPLDEEHGGECPLAALLADLRKELES